MRKDASIKLKHVINRFIRFLLIFGCMLCLEYAAFVPAMGLEATVDSAEIFEVEVLPEDTLEGVELEAYLFFREYGLTKTVLNWYIHDYLPPDYIAPEGLNTCSLLDFMVYLYEHPPGIRLDVPIELQIPDMRYGCELASMSMLMNYASGIECSKYSLWDNYRDYYPEEYDPYKEGKLPRNTFFPCHMMPIFFDFGVRPLNLSGKTFGDVIRYMVFSGHPVILWSSYAKDMPWGHVFVLTGYDAVRDRIYYNDPKYGIRYRSFAYLSDMTYYMCERNFEECKELGSEIDDSYVESVDSYLYAISYILYRI